MGDERESEFELPRKLEKLIAFLATSYRQRDKRVLQRILVNSRYYVQEESCNTSAVCNSMRAFRA